MEVHGPLILRPDGTPDRRKPRRPLSGGIFFRSRRWLHSGSATTPVQVPHGRRRSRSWLDLGAGDRNDLSIPARTLDPSRGGGSPRPGIPRWGRTIIHECLIGESVGALHNRPAHRQRCHVIYAFSRLIWLRLARRLPPTAQYLLGVVTGRLAAAWTPSFSTTLSIQRRSSSPPSGVAA